MADTIPLAEAKSLIARARAGDTGALEYLYRAYETGVYTLARRLTKTAEDAEDVLQETFLEVCRSLASWRGEGSLWGWIRTIAASKALMRYRREKVREADELDEAAGHGARGDDVPLRMDQLRAQLKAVPAVSPPGGRWPLGAARAGRERYTRRWRGAAGIAAALALTALTFAAVRPRHTDAVAEQVTLDRAMARSQALE